MVLKSRGGGANEQDDSGATETVKYSNIAADLCAEHEVVACGDESR